LEPLWQGKSGYFFYNFILSLFARFSKLDPANLYDIFISFFNCRFGVITKCSLGKREKIYIYQKSRHETPSKSPKRMQSMQRCNPSAKKFGQGYFAKNLGSHSRLASAKRLHWDFEKNPLI
jgi:hypothetical protein